MKPLQELIETVAFLRSKDGCPWDRKQTHVSLIDYLREESKELEKALRRGDWHEIEDELGDLLLNILLHAQIEQEQGRFDIDDVARSQTVKLRRRHPHVFGDADYRTAAQVKRNWHAIKSHERELRRLDVARRNGKTAGRPPARKSAGLP